MATIIFDFDHTLFDTRAFKKRMDSLIAEAGVPDHVAKKAEEEYRAKNFNNYDFEDHIETIKRSGADIHDSVYDKFSSLDLTEHIKGNVREVVQALQRRGHKTILLTKGIKKFQDLKLERSGIAELFSGNIIICPTGKEHELKKLDLDQADTYFVNDDVPETERVKSALPHIICVICKRDDKKFDYAHLDKNFHLIDTVDDLKKVLKL